MKHFVKLDEGINVAAIAMALNQHPDLWNQHGERKSYDGTPHAGTSDIWVRYNDPKNLELGYEKFTSEHESVWYPAIQVLPQLRPIIFDLMAKIEATRLGGVLITKIPAGENVLPHSDKGWHPEHYPVKVYVPIQTNDKVVNRVEDERVVMKEGEAWYFNNLVEHEVINGGNDDRVTLIVCMRTA